MAITMKKENLEEFAVLLATFCLLLNCFLLFLGRPNSFLLPLACLLLLLGFSFFRVILKPFYWVWMFLAFCLGFVASKVFLTLIFYLVLTPIGLLAKLFGKRFLDLGQKPSYWKNRASQAPNYENQS